MLRPAAWFPCFPVPGDSYGSLAMSFPGKIFPQSLFSRPFYCLRLAGMRVSAWFMYPLLSIAGEEIQ
jgi:hypothetical protein